MKFGDLFNSPAERKIGYITMILNLIVEDGWIRTEMRESFWHHYGIKYNLDLMKHKINNNIQGIKIIYVHLFTISLTFTYHWVVLVFLVMLNFDFGVL